MSRLLEKVFLTITNVCNNNCTYCFQDEKKHIYNMDYDTIRNTMINLEKMGIKKLMISGGEPILHPQFEKILKLVENVSYEVTIFTNGILDEKQLDVINNSKLAKVYISLDGADEISNYTRGINTLKKIENSIRKIKKKIVIMNTLNSSNYKNIVDFLCYCSKFDNIEKVNINPIKILHNSYRNLSLTKEMISYVNKAIKDFSQTNSLKVRSYYNFYADKIMNCGAGINSISIDYNGDVAACIFGTSVDKAKFVIDNIKEHSIDKIWARELNWLEDTSESLENCCKCGFYKQKCTGVCKIEMEILNSIQTDLDFICSGGRNE